jgi:hypothetical protein
VISRYFGSFDQIINWGMKLVAQKIGKEVEDSLIIPLWEMQSRRETSAPTADIKQYRLALH